jgi:hypothetical protein
VCCPHERDKDAPDGLVAPAPKPPLALDAVADEVAHGVDRVDERWHVGRGTGNVFDRVPGRAGDGGRMRLDRELQLLEKRE